MKTASFWSFDPSEGFPISIARYRPRGRLPYRPTAFLALAPTPDMLRLPQDMYLPRFLAILGALDAAKVWEDIHALAGDLEPVLLCWERPEDIATGKTFCHRRIVARWFRQSLGAETPEVLPRSLRVGAGGGWSPTQQRTLDMEWIGL